jgi:hypothetical protein
MLSFKPEVNKIYTSEKEGAFMDHKNEKAVGYTGDPESAEKPQNQTHRIRLSWIEIVANVIMWAIAAVMVAFGIFLGVSVLLSLFGSGDYIVGVIICAGFILFGMFLAFVFISMFKFISNMIFYSGIFKDYQRRKNKGESRGKYNIY